MGLSNEERRSGIFWAIRRMVENARKLPENDNRYTKLRELAEQLWPAYLGPQNNAMHWILGSSASNVVSGNNYTPWDTGVGEQIESAARQPQEAPSDDPELCYLSIKSLLPEPQTYVYEVFSWSEQLVYYLRRYNDDFLRRYSKLSEVCSRIQGECFPKFSDDPAYARAYLASRICYQVYASNGVAPTVLREKATHYKSEIHDIFGVQLERLVEMHTEIVKARRLPKRKRHVTELLVVLEIVGRHYCRECEHADLIQRLRVAKWGQQEIAQVQAALKKFCVEKELETDYDEDKDADGELFYKYK